ERINEALFAFLRERAGDDYQIVLLHEGDTFYGSTVGNAVQRHRNWLSIPYPLHVSQLWSAYQRQTSDITDQAAQLDANARRALSLFPEAPRSPIDIPQRFYPATEANVEDRVLSNLLLRSAALDSDFVGIVGSNVSDIIFLAHLVHEQVPNAVILTTGLDLLLTHPAYTRDLQGLWMVSSYYLDPTIDREEFHLASGSDIGLFNALLEAVCSMDSQRSTGTACRNRKPRWTVAAGADENDQVWLTAVGRGAIWPIEVSGSQRFEYHSHLGSPPREFALLIAALGL